ncbi:hypothetical protein ACFLV4_01415 [Chloroflexota bacterium]
MNRTKSFINLNRFKSGRAIKRLTKILHDKNMGEGQKRVGKK